MTINSVMTLLVAELEDGEVPAPLTQSFTLASVWADLARLAGETPPAAGAAVVADVLDATCEPLPRRRPVHAGRTVGGWLPAD